MGIGKVTNSFDGNAGRLPDAQLIFNGNEKPEDKVKKAIKLGPEVYLELGRLAYEKGDDELLNEVNLYRSYMSFNSQDNFGEDTHALNKVIVNVALDKIFFIGKENYAFALYTWVAPYFVHAIKTARPKFHDEVLDRCCSEMIQSSRWVRGARDFMTPPEGESCLIPVTNARHATLLRIENTGGGKCRVLYYNTGDGIEKFHAKGEKAGTYQTFIEYKDVPLEDLSNFDAWDILIDSKLSSMSEVYALIDQLCSRGKKEPPSIHPEYYEAIQKSGSCAFQSILAMIRERLISSLDNPAEGLALYKIAKEALMSAFERIAHPTIDSKIYSLLRAKLKVMGLEMKIARMLVDPVKKGELLKEIRKVIDIDNTERPLALFGTIRKAIRQLEKLDVSSGIIQEVIEARRERDKLSKQEYLDYLDSFLNEPEKTEEWLKVFVGLLLNEKFQKTAVEWAVTRFEFNKFLLDRFVMGVNQLPPDIREELVSPINKHFQELGISVSL